jgi:hypothetical protein
MPEFKIVIMDVLNFGAKWIKHVLYYDYKRLLVVELWWVVVAVVVVGAGGGGLAVYTGTHGGFGNHPAPTASRLPSPMAAASAETAPSPLAPPVQKPSPSPTIVPTPPPGQTAIVALSRVQMGVRRCSPACPNKAADASPWYGGGMSIYCGGPNAETIHLFEGYAFTWTGAGLPIQVSVHWTGEYKYTTGKSYPTLPDTHLSQPIASKAPYMTGVHGFEMSNEYVLDPPPGLSFASASFVLTWTNGDGTTGSAASPGLFQFHCIQPSQSP